MTANEGYQGWVNGPQQFTVGDGGELEYVTITPRSKMRVNQPPGSLGGVVDFKLKPSPWTDRPVTPLHALAIIGGCAVGGFVVGVGCAAFAGSVVWSKISDALGW
jgi:hypothetical protein